MRILVFGELRSELALTTHKWTGHGFLLSRGSIGLLKSVDDQTADGGAGTLGPVTQPFMEGFRDIDRGSDRHAVIMA